MRALLGRMLALAMTPVAVAPAARAQDAAAYIVTYIEVAPAAQGQVAALLKQLRDVSRREEGSVRFEVLQRLDRRHHFAILETWKDQKAQAAHAAAAHTKQFREKLQPLEAAPYDERPHGGLEVAASTTGAARSAVYAVTHVDFIPPRKDDGIAALRNLVAPARQAPGNLRFDVLQQASRANHETVVEVWKDRKALEGHAVAPHVKTFRRELLPMSGSLYDERLYTAL